MFIESVTQANINLCLFGLYNSQSGTYSPAEKHAVEDENGCRFGFRSRL